MAGCFAVHGTLLRPLAQVQSELACLLAGAESESELAFHTAGAESELGCHTAGVESEHSVAFGALLSQRARAGKCVLMVVERSRNHHNFYMLTN